jgi:hypothetical protein
VRNGVSSEFFLFSAVIDAPRQEFRQSTENSASMDQGCGGWGVLFRQREESTPNESKRPAERIATAAIHRLAVVGDQTACAVGEKLA